MDENIKKNAVVKMMSEVECYPVIQEDIAGEQYTKLPIDKIASMGIAFQPMLSAFQSLAGQVGKEGIYKVTFPAHAAGGSLVRFSGENAFMGGITAGGSDFVGQARLTAIPFDPTMVCMAAVMMAVNQKLDAIQEAQKEIIEFLQLKEKAMLRGNVAVLQEILEEYRYNWDNDKFKNNKHIQVQEVKRDSEQSIIFCRDQIEKKVSKKSFVHRDRDVKSKIQKVQEEFKDYELALYLFSFSSFLEVMLLENFDEGYLGSVSSKIELYAEQYHELYLKCREMIESDSKSSIQAHVLKGVAGFNKAMGTAIAAIPKISDGKVDENLIKAGNRVDDFNIKRTETTMELFANDRVTSIQPFIDNIDTVNRIYNRPMEMLFDNENIYFGLAEAK